MLQSDKVKHQIEQVKIQDAWRFTSESTLVGVTGARRIPPLPSKFFSPRVRVGAIRYLIEIRSILYAYQVRIPAVD